jgi:hypothetical protein
MRILPPLLSKTYGAPSATSELKTRSCQLRSSKRIWSAMAFTRENYRMVRERLMEIMYWIRIAHQANGRRKNAT